jgi:hypothetical protein
MKMKVKTEAMMRMVKDTLEGGQKAIFTVTGSSMEPFFKDNITSVTLTKKASYHVNDVVLFWHQGSYKLHRIIKMSDELAVCKGDHLFSQEIVEIDDIFGYVESFETKGKTVDVNNQSYKIKVFFWKIFKPILVRLRRRR